MVDSSSGIGRMSTWVRQNSGRDNVIRKQIEYSKDSIRLNTGKRLIENYDQLNGAREITNTTGLTHKHDQLSTVNAKAGSELELAESALKSMKELLDQVKDDALKGASETQDPTDLSILGSQMRNLGENLYQLANTKLGNKYVFGGLQSDKKVLKYTPGDLFGNASYKEGLADLGERQVDKQQSSISLTNLFNTNSQSAVYDGTVFTSPLAANAELNLVVHDGKSEIFVGDIALTTGDTTAVVVTKINAAFNAAGGLGSIVSNNAGALKFDTSLITGNVESAKAAIIIGPGNTLPNSLASLGLTSRTENGVSKDLRQALNELDSAYNSGDNARVRNTLIDIEENLRRLTEAHSLLGDLVTKFEDRSKNNSDIKDIVQKNYTEEAVIPVAEAVQKLSATQNVLTATMRSSATLIKQNIFDMIMF
ncbi:MAG: hypothetical protein LW817_09005 [Candidatus Caenarcaniphilales bacterium]|jgi:flagellin-like hook-associated protein FlgL|nr:hypothetical protein [Candidatus Caenarcaniphilales bacterium]